MLDEHTTECCPRCGRRCPVTVAHGTGRRSGLYCPACDRWFTLSDGDD